MANHAYRDKERRDLILASEALEENRDKYFYCPYPLYNSKLFVCAGDGSRKHILEQLNLRINILQIVLMQIVQSVLITMNLMSSIFHLKMQCKIF